MTKNDEREVQRKLRVLQRTREAIAEEGRLQALFDLIARGRPAMARGGPVEVDG